MKRSLLPVLALASLTGLAQAQQTPERLGRFAAALLRDGAAA